VLVNKRVTVFGAYGHTANFVVAELRRRGFTPILAGRDAVKLRAASEVHSGAEVRVASVDDPGSLDAAMDGSAAIINCAGPFLDTAEPLIESAIRSRIHYLDIAAEQAAVLHVFDRFSIDARANEVVIAPALAFFGGLGDLMATAALGDWDSADEIRIAVALDSWHPTRGTRITGQRNPGPRYFFTNGVLERRDPAPASPWNFPEPFGTQDVVSLSFAESIVIARHLRTNDIRVFMSQTALRDVRDPDTPAPQPADATGRSSQIFLMDVIVRRGDEERRMVARGRDIYAITAPIVVEAAERILQGRARRKGVVAAGEAFDARDFLDALSSIEITTF
jgi:saccharopine dehydrogenase-like NADP-dependent oxidoreductase